MSKCGTQWHGTDCPAKPCQLPSKLGDITTHTHTFQFQASDFFFLLSSPAPSRGCCSLTIWSRKIYCAANVFSQHFYTPLLFTYLSDLSHNTKHYQSDLCTVIALDTEATGVIYEEVERGREDWPGCCAAFMCCQDYHNCQFYTHTTWQLNTPEKVGIFCDSQVTVRWQQWKRFEYLAE